MAVDPFALTDLATIKEYLNIGPLVTSQDLILEKFINASSAHVESYLDRKILQRSWTEYQDGRLNDRIMLRHWPIQKPSELWDDLSAKFTNPDNQIPATDFEIEGDPAIGVQLLAGLRFSRGKRNIKVVYEAGYTTVPYEIEQATIFIVEFMYDLRSDRRIGVSTKSKNAESTTFLEDLPRHVKNLLDPYKRIEFGHAPIAVQNG